MVERGGKVARDGHPGHEGHRRDGHDHWHKDAGDLVGHALDGSLGASGLVHQADNARKGGVLPHRRCLDGNPAATAHGGGGHAVARALLHRDGLSGDGGLVDGGGALEHHAVHRHGLAGANDDALAGANVLGGHAHLDVVPHHGGRLGSQVHEGGNGVGGLALGAGLEVLAQVDEGQDHTGRVQVEAVHGLVCSRHVHGTEGPGHAVEGDHAVGEGRGRAQRNERVHVGGAVPERLEAGHKVVAVDQQDGNAEQKLRERGGHHVVHAIQARHLRPAKHGAHGHVEERHAEGEGHHQLAEPLVCGLARELAGSRGRGARTAASGRVAAQRPVPGVLYGGHHRGGRGVRAVKVQLHRVLEQVDVGLGDAWHVGGRPLHARRARRAGHSLDVKGLSQQGSPHMNFLKRPMTSSTTSVSPAWTRSTTQVSRWSCMTSRETALTALSTAASWVRTSPQ